MTQENAGHGHRASEENVDQTTVPLLLLSGICLGIFLSLASGDGEHSADADHGAESAPPAAHGE